MGTLEGKMTLERKRMGAAEAGVGGGTREQRDRVTGAATTSSTPSGLKARRLGRAPNLSVVIPCYNEEENILPMHERLTRALDGLTPTYEIVFVNNGSYDGSSALLDALATADPHVSVITLSRNFGSQGAYTSGFEYASGDCVISLDGDIQDPPELIPALVAKWLEGYDVVYGIRVRRKGSVLRRIGYKAFYRLLHRLSYVNMPADAGDFSLVDRRVVDVINSMPERSRLLRGLRAWAGFRQTGVPYTREDRHAGRTSFSLLDYVRWASMGIVTFSYAPLELISYLAAGAVALSTLALVVYTTLYFLFPSAPRGFQTLLVIVLFLGSVQLLCLSIIGAYLGKIFEEIKGRPKYVVQDIQNDHRRAHGDGAQAITAPGYQMARAGGQSASGTPAPSPLSMPTFEA
jgi:polyisoprenyl-phosphate glycosyltransferase